MNDKTPDENGLQFFYDACQRLGIDEQLTNFMIAPSREIRVELPLRRDDGSISHYSGYRVQHHNALGPYKGGLRYHPHVDMDEFRDLARLMTLKTALTRLPLGGAKGGVNCDTHDLSEDELQRLTRYFVRKIHRDIGPNIDIPAPDVGTNSRVMAWICDEYSLLHGHSPATVTGKPLLIGGSEGRDAATGRGVALTIQEYANHRADSLESKTVAIQGFGNVGYNSARELSALGMKIIAVSDSGGTAVNRDGLDIEKVSAHKKENGSVAGFQDSDTAPANSVLQAECDYLIPAALGGVITSKNVDSVKAKVIVEAANHPVTYSADKALCGRDIDILPDILANSGGVIVSYFEWVQNLQQMAWSADEVDKRLQKQLRDSCSRVFAVKTGKHCSYRDAAYELALERLKDAICMTMF